VRTARYPIIIVAAILGCSDSKPYNTAAVSGRVTLDGQPLAGARISFMPVHTAQDGTLSGPEAYAETDTDGHYSLRTIFKERGATIGRNRVMVTTRKLEAPPEADRVKGVKVLTPERVPNKYSTEKAALHFDVPAGGTSSANFDLTTR